MKKTEKNKMVLVLMAFIYTSSFVMFNGCGAKKPTTLDKSADSVQINNALLESHHSFVPKDPYLANSSWVYSIEAIPSGDYFFKNEQMVKVFLLAHNCQEIIIMGEQDNAMAYKRYLKNNGVKAFIRTQPIELNEKNKKYVKLLFFNSKIADRKSDWNSMREINTDVAKHPYDNFDDLDIDNE